MAMSVLNLEDLKAAYNVLILREKKAEIFLENNNIPQITRDKWIPEFNKVTECLSMLMRDYKKITGQEMQDSEVLNGFN